MSVEIDIIKEKESLYSFWLSSMVIDSFLNLNDIKLLWSKFIVYMIRCIIRFFNKMVVSI